MKTVAGKKLPFGIPAGEIRGLITSASLVWLLIIHQILNSLESMFFPLPEPLKSSEVSQDGKTVQQGNSNCAKKKVGKN